MVSSLGIDASNNISESLHTSFTAGLTVGGTIRLDNCEAKGQTHSNNDFEQRHASLVTGRKWKNGQV